MSVDGASKKIAIGVIVGVLVLVASLIITSAWKDYAKVGYQLSATKWAYSGQSLRVDLKLNNEGNIDAIPVSTVYFLNATIQNVSIPNVAEYQLSRYCCFNETAATFTNLTIPAGWGLGVWASVYVIPDEGVPSFRVYSRVTLHSDFWHPHSKPVRILPYELTYNATDNGVYELLD